jgi:hypothetical protein
VRLRVRVGRSWGEIQDAIGVGWRATGVESGRSDNVFERPGIQHSPRDFRLTVGNRWPLLGTLRTI